MRIDDLRHLIETTIIEKAVNEAATAIPTINAARSGSTPDDSGAGGYFVTTEPDDVVEYRAWFRVGHAVGTGRIRPR